MKTIFVLGKNPHRRGYELRINKFRIAWRFSMNHRWQELKSGLTAFLFGKLNLKPVFEYGEYSWLWWTISIGKDGYGTKQKK